MVTARQAITYEDPAPSFMELFHHEGGDQRSQKASRWFSFNLTMGSQWTGPCMIAKMTALVDTALGYFSLQELNNGTLHKSVTKMGLKPSIATPILFKNSSLTLMTDYVSPIPKDMVKP